MTDYKTPLQKKLDAKHKKLSIPSNHYSHSAWFNGFTIQPSKMLDDIDYVEMDRKNRITKYKQDIMK